MKRLAKVYPRLLGYAMFISILGGIASLIGPPHHGLIKAGIGIKSSNRRNFEAGILTNDPAIVEAASEQFDTVWRGEHCTRCGRRQYCGDPIQ